MQPVEVLHFVPTIQPDHQKLSAAQEFNWTANMFPPKRIWQKHLVLNKHIFDDGVTTEYT